MATRDKWMQKILELGRHKPQERVLANGKVEVMTTTQAYRFKELQSFDNLHEQKRAEDAPQAQPHYSLVDAADRLAVGSNDIIDALALGTLRCYVAAAGLQGTWQLQRSDSREGSGGRVRMPSYLALSPADCTSLQELGGVNVLELEHPGSRDGRARFRLREPLYVDSAALLLLHPLPSSVNTRR